MSELFARVRNMGRAGGQETSSLATLLATVLLGVAGMIGFVARLMPLRDLGGTLFWQHMSEDGYLMQTVARNMAIGLGMSTAEGSIPTNGVQPLATLAFAALHAVAGGSRVLGIALVTIFSTLVALATAWCLYRLMLRLLIGLPHGAQIAIAAAALWLVGPGVFKHSVNGLETGVYHLFIVLALGYYLKITQEPAGVLSTMQRLTLGGLLGLTFLARNDAVFLIAALLLVHTLAGAAGAGGGRARRAVDSLVAGAASLVVASPWLIHNHRLFGSIVPISGTAQSHTAALGSNLGQVPANLINAMLLFVPIPSGWEARGVVQAACVAGVLLVAALAVWRLWPVSLAMRRWMGVALLFSACLCGYYGVFFGAPWFIPRYLSALSPLLWPLAVAAIVQAVWVLADTTAQAKLVLTTALFALVVFGSAMAMRAAPGGTALQHRQVVQWVDEHVTPEQWVGAVQTGTLGFFHDRTINLDGKVNPVALRLMLDGRDIRSYVAGSKIDYIVDWDGVKDWIEVAPPKDFSDSFALRFSDPQRNLMVIERKSLGAGSR